MKKGIALYRQDLTGQGPAMAGRVRIDPEADHTMATSALFTKAKYFGGYSGVDNHPAVGRLETVVGTTNLLYNSKGFQILVKGSGKDADAVRKLAEATQPVIMSALGYTNSANNKVATMQW